MSQSISATSLSQTERENFFQKIPAGLYAFFIVLLGFGLSHMLLVKVYDANLETPALYLFLVGAVALILFSRRSRPAVQAGLGLIAGLFFWSAVGEILSAGELYTQPAIWGVVLVLTIFLALRKETRCDFFIVLQKWLGLRGSTPDAGHWHTPAVAFGFFYTVWIGHMFELTAYYSPAFGIHSWLTSGILIVSLAATPFLIYLLYRTRSWAMAWGRAAPIVLIFWMGIEILMKWQVIHKPW